MPLEQRITAAANIKTAYASGPRQTDRSIFDSRAMKSPRLFVGKLGWPKEVPRIANLDDEPRRPKSSAGSHTVMLRPIVMPRIIAATMRAD
jgi:hypothetical protein